jgi:hypothetical protein
MADMSLVWSSPGLVDTYWDCTTSWEGDFSANRRVSTVDARASSSRVRSCPLRSARRGEGLWDVVPTRALIH